MQTERLILRQWKEEDKEPFASMNADPRVREHFPTLLTREQSDASVDTFHKEIERDGYGLWAAELKETGEFIGFIGIHPVPFEANFTPATEIGWRLAHEFWGKGYATEGAQAALDYAFQTLYLSEVVAFTVIGNKRSENVMHKIGMTHGPEDFFDHPMVPEGHPMRRHILYRIERTYA